MCFVLVWHFAVCGVELRASWMLVKCSTTALYHQPCFVFVFLLFILRQDSGLSWTLPVAQVDLKLDCLDSACQVPGIPPVPPGLPRSYDNSNMTGTVTLRTDSQASHTGGACPGAGSFPPVCLSPVAVFGLFVFFSYFSVLLLIQR